MLFYYNMLVISRDFPELLSNALVFALESRKKTVQSIAKRAIIFSKYRTIYRCR
jgi:hypothetical protein